MRPADLPDKKMMKAAQGQVSGVGPFGKSISLQYLCKKGAVILGHLSDVVDDKLHFKDDAEMNVREGDAFSSQVKMMIDKFIEANSMNAPQPIEDEGDEPDANASCASHITSLHLNKENITAVIWTTGFTADFSWLKLPVLDDEGMPVHNEGQSSIPRLYFIGFPWLRSRKSGIIYGMQEDAPHIATCLNAQSASSLIKKN
jgi:putative flavoprotein involved in K+ transport